MAGTVGQRVDALVYNDSGYQYHLLEPGDYGKGPDGWHARPP